MEPVVALGRTLYQEFVEVLLRLIADVEQDGGVAHQLLDASHADVGGAACQVVRSFHTAYRLVHRLRPVAAIYNDGGIFFPS